ncbi:MAG: 30S ribosomal protein S4 [Sulfolobales archaeon]|nr:30S ribosomal protein S4 [Sulfolobales archaeon]MCX8208828.1 30S ribosomal protein S4 [Sulfolobales archaeon]MDW8010147.1 30S ribosomal protein S4 [Sulfolobales archaeon]
MGDPKKSRKTWEKPGHPWIKERLVEEMELLGQYGLRNKRELWKAQTILRTIRERAKALLSLPEADRVSRERALVKKLYNIGLLESDKATIDDILGLTVRNVLERRLQTVVYKKGLARTIHEARQLIAHGHIAIAGRRAKSPGRLVSRNEEDLISYSPTSPYYMKQPSRAST